MKDNIDNQEDPILRKQKEEQLKSLEKEAEEKRDEYYPLLNVGVKPSNTEIAKREAFREGYIAGAQRSALTNNERIELYELRDAVEQQHDELKEKDEQLRNERELFVQTTAKQAEKFHQLQQENTQLKEELKREELKMEAIQGHVDALWEENAQLKEKVREAAEKAWDAALKRDNYDRYTSFKMWKRPGIPLDKAEYLKTINDAGKADNDGK